MEVRVRYAPSPTGNQHIGGVRTALINYLFARSQGGKFLLRLEDTDRTRYSDEYVKNLYDTFKWLGFYWDEGPDVGGPSAPYIQSERFALYKEHAEKLVSMGQAYYCFCAEDRLAKLHADAQDEEAGEGGSYGYDRRCRNVDPAEASRRLAAGEKAVIRLKIPLDGTTKFRDALLGDIEWKNADVSPDPVLLKSDGFPTYHLANIVDDHLMHITHVMRAQEWISSTPMHVIMYRAFGWTPPEFCHLPMVLGQDGSKLSKRHGATSLNEFRKNGYLPEALINYVAHLGCSYEEGREIFTLKELEGLFRVEKLNKASAVFDYTKLEWYNGQYIRMKTDAELAALVMPFLAAAGLVAAGSDGAPAPGPAQAAVVLGAMPLVKERLKFLTDAAPMMRYLFEEPALPAPEEFIPKKLDAARAAELLAAAAALLPSCDLADVPACEAAFRAEAERLGAKFGDLMMPLRVAATGSRVSPPLFESIHLVGLEKCLARIERARKLLVP
ncbi:MAG: glutamate--tRNA ligase [Spirochaetaceae bacterium]|nr:glutamate--tRNA ligase [Spirochaetaceae bacterium]